ncbi:MAG TPA: putative zinc-binding metallopeptidase [Polyangiaceae bacterium]
MPRRSSPKSARRARFAGSSDEELLKLRLCDLPVDLKGAFIRDAIAELRAELAERRIALEPTFWVSEEWFSPDGIPGIAVPFYLCHPRLMRLEKRQMFEVEGGSRDWCMRILRHEAGHTVDTAYRLSRRKRFRELFGNDSERYPDEYSPKAYSKRHVLHLDSWYAQSHPAEDFAETFAVWLKPGSRWRARYEGWPALKKLEYVDELMSEIRGKPPLVTSRSTVDPIETLKTTLGEHYAQKRARYETEQSRVYDGYLWRLFSQKPHGKGQAAASFLRQHRADLRRRVADWTGEYQYTVDQVLQEMIVRCRELGLRVAGSRNETLLNTLLLLTAQTMQLLRGRHRRVAL